ncbi:MAG TPA: acyl-CoA dehydrogenase family protein [Anaerolineales bacterium]|nr:acyl-CoA dehydrogenase family protein [Anaerolineales bacterium]
MERLAALDRARGLAERFAERATMADRDGVLPESDIRDLKASGLLGLSVPGEWGGSGLGLADCVAVQLVLARGSTSSALVAAMQFHLFGHAAETQPWSSWAWAELCRRAVAGELLNSVASEPELGSPSRGGLPKTEVRPHPDGGWVVDGHKAWTTGGRWLDQLLVRCRCGDEAAVVWIPTAAPGVSWRETWRDSLSLRASESHDLVLDGVRVPESYLIARGETGLRQPNAWFALLTAATYLGAAWAARERLSDYARRRVPTALGRSIATLPGIQRQIGEMQATLDAAETFLLAAAGDWDRAGPGGRLASYARVVAAKHVAVEAALRVTETALRVAGGASLSAELTFERYFRDARAGLMHPPAGDAALELVGRAVLDLPQT